MTCQLLKGRDFQDDLRYSIIASAFWRRLYPNYEVFLATNRDSPIPSSYEKQIRVIRFPFEKFPSALSRQRFMRDFANSDMFDSDTIFTGHDVVFTQRLPSFEGKAVTNYRYHPSQPYCSDFVILKYSEKQYCSSLMSEIVATFEWMPREILTGAGDQLSWALTLGKPEDAAFNGAPFFAPRRPDVFIVPAEKYLFTPNDFFPSRYESFGSVDKAPFDYDLAFVEKFAIHFKGNRKQEMFKFAKWAYENRLIPDLDIVSPKELFKH